MWFSAKTLVAVDTRSAAVAVFKNSFAGPRLERFGSEKFASRARMESLFSDVLSDSRDAVSRLAKDLGAPMGEATLLLPVGAAFPAVLDLGPRSRPGRAEVEEADMARFRLAPLLPFPVALADVQTERCDSAGGILAQAVLKSLVAEGRSVMGSLGYRRVRVASALSASLRGFRPSPNAVDLIFGDSACAICVRGATGLIESVHLRLLLEGDDREQRALDESFRAASQVAQIRVAGCAIDGLRRKSDGGALQVTAAFGAEGLPRVADPQAFPFLAVFSMGLR